jgi:hypothetical protein
MRNVPHHCAEFAFSASQPAQFGACCRPCFRVAFLGCYIPAQIGSQIAEHFGDEQLTDRELDVLSLIRDGRVDAHNLFRSLPARHTLAKGRDRISFPIGALQLTSRI